MRPTARVPARRRLLATVLAACLAALGLALAPPQQATVHAAARASEGVLLVDNGDPAKRITLVLLGDGYTAAELPRYRTEAATVWQALTAVEPFRTYQHLFDVRRVDVVSARSGLRAGSPLGMHFGCEGIARLLCADADAVSRRAGGSGGPQYLIALANSSAYGGEGGDATTTLAAGSPDAARILQHEMGHTVGGLGDEYDSAPGAPAEHAPGYPNLGSADEATMREQRQKWWRWLGATDPSGGAVGAYLSANGLYRPTRDSIMRTLGGVYNLPSREAIIESIYRQVGPVDRVDPAPGTADGRPMLRVRPVQLVGPRRIEVTWQVDGRPAPAAAVGEDSLDTARLELTPGQWTLVCATVRDTTPWLRDESFRAARMTSTVSWSLHG
ncbi:hypothetical protein ABIA33_004066 [Streptacidiphilus sp. MAP12-16]|uniref:M64 family metallopeptidase n=1 Tax=Streptacidiphilus sp. MAP12-16 TaxID=3156300 RepID=UPI003513489E